MTQTNRHPVDELVDVKAKMAALAEREKSLKAKIIEMAGERDAVGGDEFIATVALQSRKSLDRKGLEKRVGKDVVAGFEREGEPYYVVRTAPRAIEEAA
ncbi:hypothetical protein U0C82_03910 [Fulvimarina sp. 2208YS6-2-32]|uniref:Uncharacterized protein n=1 Tax=Fulvimarina uroteuthidis TaxID=3098149 RepID=A0ABU5HZT1_9HYPH|nr:hypothetical protein [Fulvimarina sp. 2208YS6-2-32]MDY8108295.1 hypothetical protein [Fulvimarina sp. 2208YS6-2-32]